MCFSRGKFSYWFHQGTHFLVRLPFQLTLSTDHYLLVGLHDGCLVFSLGKCTWGICRPDQGICFPILQFTIVTLLANVAHLVSPDRVPPGKFVHKNTIVSTHPQARFQCLYLCFFLHTRSPSPMGLPPTPRKRPRDLFHCCKFPGFQHAMDCLHASLATALSLVLY